MISRVPVKFGDQADRQSHNLAIQAHRIFDLQRRLKDAQHLLDTEQGSNTKALEDWNAKWKKQN